LATTLSNDDVSVLLLDDTDRVWIGTRSGGLDEFDASTNQFIRHNISDGGPGKSDDILDLDEDEDGNLLVATQEGLYTYERQRRTFKPCLQSTSIWKRPIFRIEDDAHGSLWIGIENDGIYRYNKRTSRLDHLSNSSEPSSLSSNAISSIYQDRSHNIWIGTYTLGINVYDAKEQQFMHFKNNPLDKNSVNGNSILSFAEGKEGIWIGTDGGGLDLFDPNKRQFIHHVAESDKQKSIGGNNVGCLITDNDGRIWSASWGEGVKA
jgi:ligand-binding sensor domain-containing protein